jgi:peptidoglycan/LPS O-acetylase OafA/YrhL
MTTLAEAALAYPGRREAATASLEEVHPAYRPDIDGLRAVAVLSVVVFHFFPSALPGGFVGVDIFFVISGYLISRVIIGELEKNRFSFAGFYARRIRRIFPALIVVMAAALAFGWTALLSAEYSQLGKHAAAGAAFVSNLVLWRESGYFDNAAIAKPLLHLWSLGVEEQFYIVWPAFLWLAWRLRLNLLLVATGLAILSFGTNVIATSQSPVSAFYSPFTRFWELMMGAMLAYGKIHRQSPAPGAARPAWRLADRPRVAWLASMLGGSLIVLGIIFVRERNFPGWQALIPTIGAALLIFAGPRSPVNRIVLSSAPMVTVGLISYPLYLWHWPLLSFSRIVHGEPGASMKATLLITGVILAGLTYRLIERPVKAARGRASITLLLGVLMVAAGGAGFLVMARKGLEHRAVVHANAPLEQSVVVHFPPFTAPCPFLPSQKELFQCYTDMREPPRFALLGDSKAGALFPGLFRTSAPGGTWMFIGSGEIGPLVPVLSDSPVYAYVSRAAVDAALRTIEGTKSIETVVIATATRALFGLANAHSIADLPKTRNYTAALNGLDASIGRLLAAGKRVVLLVDNPTLPYMQDCIARKTSSSFFNRLLATPPKPDCQITVAMHLGLSRPYRDLLGALRARHPGRVSVFDTIPILCDTGGDLCTPTADGRLLYGVTDHISDHASRLVGHALNAQLHPEGAARARKPMSRSEQATD